MNILQIITRIFGIITFVNKNARLPKLMGMLYKFNNFFKNLSKINIFWETVKIIDD